VGGAQRSAILFGVQREICQLINAIGLRWASALQARIGAMRIRSTRPFIIIFFTIVLLSALLEAAPAPAPTPASSSSVPNTAVSSSLEADEVLGHLGRTIAWFRRVQTLQPDTNASDDLVSRDRLRDTSTTALQLAFDFGHAAVPLVQTKPDAAAGGADAKASESAVSAADADSGANTNTTNPNANLDRAVAKSAERVAMLQSRLNGIEAQRAGTSSPAAQKTLSAQRDELQAALALAKDVQATVQNLAQFAARGATTGQGSGGLASQIAQLERSVPEARRPTTRGAGSGASATSGTSGNSAPPATSGTSGAGAAPGGTGAAGATGATQSDLAPFRPESAGLIALSTQVFTLRAQRQQIDDLIRQTDALMKGLDEIRAPLVNSAREFMKQTDSLASATHDAAEAGRMRAALQDAAGQFKHLSTVIVPVAEQAIATEATRGELTEWRDRISAQIGTTARFLIFRAGMLLTVLIVVLALSEVWRRATFRYFHDTRRRRQFLLLRRIVVTVVIAIAVTIGVVSEVGSLATYAGFVTAGVAVAMQNVILAVVAYFFLIGRSGVRVGDRITLAGVTGNVIEIGLVRIYLMELAGRDFHPTGRIVVLSNAVLFQPAALFKHVPGADYVWHVVTLTVDASVDAAALETRVKAAADSVYEDYRPLIEEQNATLQRYVNIETLAPRPEIAVRLTSAGLECTVRYPAEPARAALTDRKMIDALRTAVAKDPALPLISSTGPTVE
jgi:small-conductance mechanosensitive channel